MSKKQVTSWKVKDSFKKEKLEYQDWTQNKIPFSTKKGWTQAVQKETMSITSEGLAFCRLTQKLQKASWPVGWVNKVAKTYHLKNIKLNVYWPTLFNPILHGRRPFKLTFHICDEHLLDSVPSSHSRSTLRSVTPGKMFSFRRVQPVHQKHPWRVQP